MQMSHARTHTAIVSEKYTVSLYVCRGNSKKGSFEDSPAPSVVVVVVGVDVVVDATV